MTEACIESAKPILKEAVTLDKEGDAALAVEKYLQGIEMLLEGIRLLETKDKRKSSLNKQLEDYMGRVQKLKKNMKDNNSYKVKHMEMRRITEDSVGHSYERVFEKVIDKKLTFVHIQDAYIVAHHQLVNFVRFCEYLVGTAINLERIKLTTSEDGQANQKNFDALAESLSKRGISLTIYYSKNIHDREIRFDNGWVVKSGRGLDYFKPSEGKYVIGAFDMNLRSCKESNIEIIRIS